MDGIIRTVALLFRLYAQMMDYAGLSLATQCKASVNDASDSGQGYRAISVRADNDDRFYLWDRERLYTCIHSYKCRGDVSEQIETMSSIPLTILTYEEDFGIQTLADSKPACSITRQNPLRFNIAFAFLQ